MTPPSEDPAGAPASARCERCATPLVHDQRYCVACGARRGPLPASIAGLIAAGLRAGGAFPAEATLTAAAATDAHDDEHPLMRWMPAPRAAALAVMALLAFGVIVGAVVSPPADSAGTGAVVLVQQPAAATAPLDTGASDDLPADDAAPVAEVPAPVAEAPAPESEDPAPQVPDAPALPDVRHLFLIVLTGHGYAETFGAGASAAATAPYLTQQLPREGELLANYYGVAQSELANGVALISGQGPTVQTIANCPQYGDVAPATIDRDGQVAGDGCVYPSRAQTLGDQLTAGGQTWKAYVEGLASGAGAGSSAGTGTGTTTTGTGTTTTPASAPATCRHPAPGTADANQAPQPGDPYVTWRNPFVYFHSLLDTPACAAGDVDLGQLAGDLGAASTTPTVSYVVPDRCHDGSDQPCAPGQPAGLAAADAWLRTIVPQIEGSPAYRDGGVIAITFDEAPQSGPNADSGSCCDAQTFPNLGTGATPGGTVTTPTTTVTTPTTTTPTVTQTTPTTPTVTQPTTTTPTTPATTTPTTPGLPPSPPGGGRVGLLLLSRFVVPGTVNQTEDYNHFSLLRSIEDLFGLQHLGYAADPALPAFDKVVWNAKTP